MKPSLFQTGEFQLHSGSRSRWKIECDVLTTQDWKALALMLAERLPPFGTVLGIPRGGMLLAHFLRDHAKPQSKTVLIADDVFTTGRSFVDAISTFDLHKRKPGNDLFGAVVFNRSGKATPAWIMSLFSLSPIPQHLQKEEPCSK